MEVVGPGDLFSDVLGRSKMPIIYEEANKVASWLGAAVAFKRSTYDAGVSSSSTSKDD